MDDESDVAKEIQKARDDLAQASGALRSVHCPAAPFCNLRRWAGRGRRAGRQAGWTRRDSGSIVFSAARAASMLQALAAQPGRHASVWTWPGRVASSQPPAHLRTGLPPCCRRAPRMRATRAARCTRCAWFMTSRQALLISGVVGWLQGWPTPADLERHLGWTGWVQAPLGLVGCRPSVPSLLLHPTPQCTASMCRLAEPAGPAGRAQVQPVPGHGQPPHLPCALPASAPPTPGALRSACPFLLRLVVGMLLVLVGAGWLRRPAPPLPTSAPPELARPARPRPPASRCASPMGSRRWACRCRGPSLPRLMRATLAGGERHGMNGMAGWDGLAWPGLALIGMAWHGVAWHAWHGWHAMVMQSWACLFATDDACEWTVCGRPAAPTCACLPLQPRCRCAVPAASAARCTTSGASQR